MPKRIEEMTENEKRFLLSLIEDGSKTDTEIANEKGMSKSTANRIRRSFEESGVIAEYLPIVRLDSVGIEVFATIAMECEEPVDEGEIASIPNVIFMGETDDFKRSYIIFAGFSTFDEYNEFIEDFKDEYREKVSSFENHLIAPGNIIKEDFTQLVKHNLKEALQDASED
ncbi:MAG: Lrp/AsnC family transcriptional regulator [Candidatus Nanohaloarchaea archaeon]|nr:Lrp/AsnC family transcriptional regulator [Candidatus Nanohaloarchaea archaeon]